MGDDPASPTDADVSIDEIEVPGLEIGEGTGREAGDEGAADDETDNDLRNEQLVGEADDSRGDDRSRVDEHPGDAPRGDESVGDDEGGTSGDETSEGATVESDSAGTDDATPSVDTYNKVVRLLQNREFPVDRTEFEAIAAGAYQLETDEVAAVLDLAVEKGLLDEEDGMLKRPE